MVNLTIVGFGTLAHSVYGPVIAGLTPHARLAGVIEVDPGRQEKARISLPGVPFYDLLSDQISAETIDGVLIATPPTTHADLAVEAFEAGLGVYVEKPLAADSTDGRRIVDAWRKAGTVGMVGFNYRFNSIVRDLERALATGEVGTVVAVRTFFGLAADEIPAWKSQRASGGGALLDLASHHIDLLRYLFQTEVRTVDCQIRSDRTEEDNASLTLTLESGVVAQVCVSLSSVEEDRVEIYGSRGKLVYDRYNSERLQRTGRYPGQIRRQLLANRLMSFVPGRDVGEKLRSPLREVSFPRAIRRFVEAVATEKPGSPDIEDGWRSLQVILAAERAHREGRMQEV